MKNHGLLFLLLFVSQLIYGQAPTIIFCIQEGNSSNMQKLKENETEIVAVPFVMYQNGKYKAIPVCELGSTESKAVKECDLAKKIILPAVAAGKLLYVLNNGVQTGTINIKKHTQYGFSDWQTHSAVLSTNPKVKLLTNNASIGVKKLTEVKSKPVLKKRKDPEGTYYQDRLVSKVDIDGDNVAELIYLCGDYEGEFFQIFSFKNKVWKKVFEGGYQGV